MVVREAARVHEGPALSGRLHFTVVPEEPAAPALIVDVLVVEGDVDGEGGGVVVRPQRRLLIRTIPDHEVHDGLGLWVVSRVQLLGDR